MKYDFKLQNKVGERNERDTEDRNKRGDNLISYSLKTSVMFLLQSRRKENTLYMYGHGTMQPEF